MENPIDSFGARLRWALEQRGVSIRDFSQQLQARGLRGRGASRPMIHRYLKDELDPPLEFVRASASLLRVRAEWLERGDGRPALEERLGIRWPVPDRDAEEELDPAESWARISPIHRKLLEGFPLAFRLGPDAQSALYKAAHTYARAVYAIDDLVGEGFDWNDDAATHELWSELEARDAELAHALATGLQQLLNALGVDVETRRRWQLDSFVVLVCEAVEQLVRNVDKLDPPLGGPAVIGRPVAPARVPAKTVKKKPRRAASKDRSSPRRKG